MSDAKTTTNHDTIRKWVEARDGRPTTVKSTASKKEPGVLRIEFPGNDDEDDDNLEEISWEAFFDKFDKEDLAFLYQDETKDGGTSRFFKFVKR